MGGRWRLGRWTVDLDRGWIRRRGLIPGRRRYPDRRLMAVLEVLIAKAGAPVSTRYLLETAWPGRVVSRDSLSTAVYELRKALGDDSASPAYIRTEPRIGYRLIAPALRLSRKPRRGLRIGFTVATLCCLAVTIAAYRGTTSAVYRPQLVVSPLEDITGREDLEPLSRAIEATLVSALVRMNPGRISAEAGNRESFAALESRMVLCDVGPVLVLRLQDNHSRRYFWSKAYPLENPHPEPSLVEYVAKDVTAALSRT